MAFKLFQYHKKQLVKTNLIIITETKKWPNTGDKNKSFYMDCKIFKFLASHIMTQRKIVRTTNHILKEVQNFIFNIISDGVDSFIHFADLTCMPPKFKMATDDNVIKVFSLHTWRSKRFSFCLFFTVSSTAYIVFNDIYFFFLAVKIMFAIWNKLDISIWHFFTVTVAPVYHKHLP